MSSGKRWSRRSTTAALVSSLAVAVHWAVILRRRSRHPGDFDLCQEFGRRFLEGEPLYEGGLHYPYTPAAAAFFAPLSPIPSDVAILVRYVVALVALAATFRMLGAMRPGIPFGKTAVVTMILASHYVIRDLDDGGLHLILLGMSVAAIHAGWRRRDGTAGLWIGLAAAVKPNLGLLIPFFAWKRRWRLAALSAAALAFWLALPIAWMGPSSGLRHYELWASVALRSAVADPVAGAEASEGRVQNQSLRASVLRLAGRRESPGPGAAVLVISLALAAAVAWRTRRVPDGTDSRWLPDASAALVLALLLSPVAWVQHFVLLVPALFVAVEAARSSSAEGRFALGALAVYAVLSLVLNREVLGRETYLVLLSWNLHAVCALIVLSLVLRRPVGS